MDTTPPTVVDGSFFETLQVFFCHGLKICIYFWYILEIIFLSFFPHFEVSHCSSSVSIDSGYLVDTNSSYSCGQIYF